MNKRQEKMLEQSIAILEDLERELRRRALFDDAKQVHEAVGLIYLAVKHEAKLIR